MAVEFLTPLDIIEINKSQTSIHGHEHRIIDRGAIDGIAYRVVQEAQYGQNCDILDLSVVTAEAINKGHAFADGNKRTALVGLHEFLAINGFKIECEDGEWIADLIQRQAADDITRAEFIEELSFCTTSLINAPW